MTMKQILAKNPVLSFFVVALLIPWSVYIPYAASRAGLWDIFIPIEVVVLAQYGPLVAAFLLTAIVEGKLGLRKLTKQALRWRVNVVWYFFSIFVTPLIGLLIVAIHFLFGDVLPAPPNLVEIFERWAKEISLPFLRAFATQETLPAILSFTVLAIMNGGVSEEFGWRGYALRKLMQHSKPFKASMIVGFLWGIWHTDNQFWEGIFKGSTVPLFVLCGHTLETMAIAVLFTWVYLRTNGSLLICILFHAAINSTFTIMSYWWPREPNFIMYAEFTIGFWILALLIAFVFDRTSFSQKANQAI
jgi:membrane protease YdiL (CAAX protease family)